MVADSTASGHGFDPHRPYQISYSFQRTWEFREAANGSNNSEESWQVGNETCGTDGKPTISPDSRWNRHFQRYLGVRARKQFSPALHGWHWR
jgi:hypothetical protein